MGKHLIDSGPKFPLTTETIHFINAAINDPLAAIAKLCGDKTILHGVTIHYINLVQHVTAGFIAYNGELVYFEPGQKYNYVQITTTVYERPHDTSGGLVNKPAYRVLTAKCVPAAGANTFLFSELVSLRQLKTIAQNPLFTQVILDKLNGIQAGAEPNVQSDWNNTNPADDAFIKNKPTNLVRYKNSANTNFIFYGAGNGTAWLVTHNLGHLNYEVFSEISLDAVGVLYANIPGYTTTILDKTANSFRVKILRTQNLPNCQMRCRLKILY